MKGLFSRARTASGAPSDENRTGSLTNSEKRKKIKEYILLDEALHEKKMAKIAILKKMKGKNYGKQKKKYSDALLGYIRRKEVDP